MRDLYYYQGLAQDMVKRDRGRDEMMAAMEKMWRGEWSLPKSVAKLKALTKPIAG